MSSQTYNCEYCGTICTSSSSYNKHTQTKKHKDIKKIIIIRETKKNNEILELKRENKNIERECKRIIDERNDIIRRNSDKILTRRQCNIIGEHSSQMSRASGMYICHQNIILNDIDKEVNEMNEMKQIKNDLNKKMNEMKQIKNDLNKKLNDKIRNITSKHILIKNIGIHYNKKINKKHKSIKNILSTN